MADGSIPFKPVVIFHGKRTIAKRENYDERVEVHFNETAYNNEELFHNWLRNTFEPYVVGIIEAGETKLIVMDSASFHKTSSFHSHIRNPHNDRAYSPGPYKFGATPGYSCQRALQTIPPRRSRYLRM
jgi:hypothetical protein